jgi:hypothetical protein
MTPQPGPASRPHITAWLVGLFVPPEEAEAIVGDFCEEYSFIASKSGTGFARAWYLRQSLRTVLELAIASFRAAPWLTCFAVAAGFLLRKLLAPLIELAIFSALDKFHVYQNHFGAYVFFAFTFIDIAHLISFLFIGFIVALVARGREMVATMSLGMIFIAMALAASLVFVIRTGEDALLFRLAWYFADSFAIMIAGVLVRFQRSAAPPRPART